MTTTVPRYWQHRIDDFRDDLKWALAEGDGQALLAHLTRFRALHATCADEHRQAVKMALLNTLWQALETAASSLPADDEQSLLSD